IDCLFSFSTLPSPSILIKLLNIYRLTGQKMYKASIVSTAASHSYAADSSSWNYSLFEWVIAHDALTSLGQESSSPAPSKSCLSRRWTQVEHDRFLQALALFSLPSTASCKEGGKGLGLGRGVATKIADYVMTRTEAQVRSHAQKYFMQLKAMRDNDVMIDYENQYLVRHQLSCEDPRRRVSRT
ncbi:hypothetical protein GUITHDRAFT_153078, partial [Guillardia theta CCMP2712]